MDLLDFYELGSNLTRCLIQTAKLRNKNLPLELDIELYEKIWWKLRFVLNDYNDFIKKLEKQPQAGSN